MQIFFTTFNQMLILFLCIISGYILTKTKIISEISANILAKLENNIFMPCLILNTFIDKCTPSNLHPHLKTLTVAVIVLIITIALSFGISYLISADEYTKKLFRYSLITPNYTFMGNALALGIFGEDFLFDYIIYTIPLTVFTYTISTNWLKGDKNTSKSSSFINPVFIAIILGLIIGLTSFRLPSFITSTLSSFAACMSPIAMLLTGLIIGNYNIRNLIKDIKIYLISLIRLIAIPAFFLIIFKLLPLDTHITALAICCLAMPLGLNTIIIPAAYGQDTATGASMALISSIISLVTIPVIFSFL